MPAPGTTAANTGVREKTAGQSNSVFEKKESTVGERIPNYV
jgi:hypothetical protein